MRVEEISWIRGSIHIIRFARDERSVASEIDSRWVRTRAGTCRARAALFYFFFTAGKTTSVCTRIRWITFRRSLGRGRSCKDVRRDGYSFQWDGYFLPSREKMKTIIPIATRGKCTSWKFHLYRRTLRRMHCIRKRAGGCNFYTYSPEFGLEYCCSE